MAVEVVIHVVQQECVDLVHIAVDRQLHSAVPDLHLRFLIEQDDRDRVLRLHQHVVKIYLLLYFPLLHFPDHF